MLTSAVTGEGVDALLDAIDGRLGADDEFLTLNVPASEGRILHWLYENAHVIARETHDDGTVVARVRIASEKKPRLLNELRSAGIPLN